MIAELVPEEIRPHAASAVIALHMLAFLVIQAALFYLIYKGLRRRTDKCVGIAFLIAAGEVLVYVAGGFHCPLTTLAEDLGAQDGSVTDIFLPRLLADNAPSIFVSLFALGLALHAKSLIQPLGERPALEERRELASPIPVPISDFESAPSAMANSVGEIDNA